MAAKEKPAAGDHAAHGQENRADNSYGKYTTAWLYRQAAKITLPYIAGAITSTKFTARKSLFLDRLTIMAEGGSDDI
jgi:hypothetical protein